METVKSSSDRSFGVVFTVVFCLIAAWPYYDRGEAPNLWAGGVAMSFLLVALIRPSLLALLNRLWTRFGLLLNKFTAPIIMGLFFFGVIFPLAMLMRLFGKRPLQLAYDRDAASYWIVREPPGPAPGTMKQQF
jgi:hypothetical protein